MEPARLVGAPFRLGKDAQRWFGCPLALAFRVDVGEGTDISCRTPGYAEQLERLAKEWERQPPSLGPSPVP